MNSGEKRRKWKFNLALLLAFIMLSVQVLPVMATEVPSEIGSAEGIQTGQTEDILELEEESIKVIEGDWTDEEDMQKHIEEQQELLNQEIEVVSEEEPLAVGTDQHVITGFVPWTKEEQSIEIEEKKSMEEIEKELGETIEVFLDGSAEATEIEVQWVCEEGYENSQAGVYRFLPKWNETEYTVAEGTEEIPAKEVSVLDEIYSIPALTYRPVDDVDPVSSVTSDGDYDGTRMFAALEPRYNPLDAGFDALPAIRDQNPYGSCWAFSSLTMGEIEAMKRGYDRDFSELHLAYFSYNSVNDPLGGLEGDFNACRGNNFMEVGGNLIFSQNILANWIGAADESLAPYNRARDTISSGLNSGIAYNDVMHLQGAYMLNLEEDAELIKEYIKKNGSVGINYGYYTNTDFYNSNNVAYYCDKSAPPNHAVTVVGWDDNFSADNFTIKPEGNGAWLVRNSWGGSGYNKYGYFWLSYYEKTLDPTAFAFEFEDADNYDHNYQYDGSMMTHYLGLNGLVKAANIFIPRATDEKGEVLKAVSFSVGSVNTDYTVEVYTNLKDLSDPASGTLAAGAVTSGKTVAQGYYTVPLRQSVVLERDVPFAVVVTLNKTAGTPMIGLEKSSSGSWYQTVASADSGQSFLLYMGSWMDCGEEYGENIRIKAFTDEVEAVPISEISLDISNKQINMGETFALTKTVQPSNAIGYKITWTSSDESVATVNDSGIVQGVGAGDAIITASSNGKSASCKVTVRFPYSDVSPIKGEWKYESVRYVTNNGMMGAISGTDQFMPDRPLSRGMFVTVLYRKDGEPYVGWDYKFSDVSYGKWYSDAVIWASERGIVDGFADGTFGVDVNITREQVAKILYIYAANKGYNVSARQSLTGYTDADNVNVWAREYMQWAVGAGLISGKPNGNGTYRLDPKGEATRAECAAMLMRFADKYGEL